MSAGVGLDVRKFLAPLPGIEPQFLGRPIRTLVTYWDIPTSFIFKTRNRIKEGRTEERKVIKNRRTKQSSTRLVHLQLSSCFRKVLGSNLVHDTDYKDWWFSSFSLVPPDKCHMISHLGQEWYFSNHVQCFMHQSFYHPCTSRSIVQWMLTASWSKPRSTIKERKESKEKKNYVRR